MLYFIEDSRRLEVDLCSYLEPIVNIICKNDITN
jgi:hypothetical protein